MAPSSRRHYVTPATIPPLHERVCRVLPVQRPPMRLKPGERSGWITAIETTTSVLIDGALSRDPNTATQYVKHGPGLRFYLGLAHAEAEARGLKVNDYAISAEPVGTGSSGEAMVLVQVHCFHSELH